VHPDRGDQLQHAHPLRQHARKGHDSDHVERQQDRSRDPQHGEEKPTNECRDDTEREHRERALPACKIEISFGQLAICDQTAPRQRAPDDVRLPDAP